MLDLKSLIRRGASERPQKITLYGVPGVGKSTFGADFPKPLFLRAEDGLIGDQFSAVDSIEATTWERTLEALQSLAADTMGYKTLVIDTMDWLEPLCEDFVIRSAGKSSVKSLEDFGYGKGQIHVAEEFRRLLAALDAINRAGLTVLNLAHSTIKTFTNPTGDNYDRYEMKLSKRVNALVGEWSDTILFANFETRTNKAYGELKAKATGGERRIIYTTHSAGWEAKNRHNLPDVMEMDASALLSAMGHDMSGLITEARDVVGSMPEGEAKVKALAAIDANLGDGRKLRAIIERAQTIIGGNHE